MGTCWYLADPTRRRTYDLGKGAWGLLWDGDALPASPQGWHQAVVRTWGLTTYGRATLPRLAADLHAFAASAGPGVCELRNDLADNDDEHDGPAWAMVGSRFSDDRDKLDPDPLAADVARYRAEALAMLEATS